MTITEIGYPGGILKMVYDSWHRTLIHISSSQSTFFSVDWKSAAAAPCSPLPPPRPHTSRQLPRGVRARRRFPARPPLGARRAGPESDESRRRPLPSLLLQCVPPTEARLVFPGSGLGESLASEPPASGLALSAVARQAQRWRRRGRPMAISRGFLHTHGRAGTHGKGGQ